jgi:Alpha-L-arabinofuranosidase B, catalytic
MATTRAFAYNPSQNPIPGTDSYGTLVIGTSNLDFSKDYGGIKWWMGPDETLGYVIGGVVSGGTHPSPIGDIGTVEFWRTDNLTTEEFLLLVNQISGQYFTNTSDAITWLNNNGYWTSYDPLLITPTPTPVIQVTPSSTSVVTSTPTPTVTVTPSKTPAPPGILDTYSGAAAAYSLRRLSSSYSGSAIRVRRSSDNAEQDIGFLYTGEIDNVALTSFVSGGNGFVTKWYDQSGNGVDTIQSNASLQPRVVNNGSIETEDGIPTLLFVNDGFNSLTTTSNFSVGSYMSTFFVNKGPRIYDYQYVVSVQGTQYDTSDAFSVIVRAGGGWQDWTNGDVVSVGKGYLSGINPRIISNGNIYFGVTGNSSNSVFLGNTNTGYYMNGNAISTRSLTQGDCDTNNVNNKLIIGSRNVSGTGSRLEGKLSELIIYKSNQFSNRLGIESNMRAFYRAY